MLEDSQELYANKNQIVEEGIQDQMVQGQEIKDGDSDRKSEPMSMGAFNEIMSTQINYRMPLVD